MIILKTLSLLSLLLYSIKNLSSSLDNLAQNKVQKILNKLTINTFSSFIIGIVVCFITQSSSIITILTISLISSQLLSLEKGIAIIIGSNIGTTITSLLFVVNTSNTYYLFIFIGVILFFINKHIFSTIILHIGLIFLSLDLIENELITLFNNTFLQNILLQSNTPIHGVLSGTIISFLIQSSSTTIILTQKLFTNKIISSILGISIMLGANIGTTISGLIFSLNSSIDGKRLAVGSLLFNIFSVLAVFPFLYIYKERIITLNTKYLISLMHIYFNLVTGIIGFFFIKPLCTLTRKIIKEGY